MTAVLNQWSERPEGPGGHSPRAINGTQSSATPGPPGPPHIPRFPGRPARRIRQRALQEANTVERAINRLKGFRAVATRYEKRAYIYLGTVTLAALTIWLRHDPRNSA